MAVEYKNDYGILVKLEVVDLDENCNKFRLEIFDSQKKRTIIYENVDITDITFHSFTGVKFV